MKIYYITKTKTIDLSPSRLTTKCSSLGHKTLAIGFLAGMPKDVQIIWIAVAILGAIATVLEGQKEMEKIPGKHDKMKKELEQYNFMKSYNAMLEEKYKSNESVQNADTTNLNV